jgi:hypothetical protein
MSTLDQSTNGIRAIGSDDVGWLPRRFEWTACGRVTSAAKAEQHPKTRFGATPAGFLFWWLRGQQAHVLSHLPAQNGCDVVI